MKRCQQEGGGFVSNPKFPGAPNIIYTYYALKTLELLKALESIDQAKVLGFVQGLMRDDGSIACSCSANCPSRPRGRTECRSRPV